MPWWAALLLGLLGGGLLALLLLSRRLQAALGQAARQTAEALALRGQLDAREAELRQLRAREIDLQSQLLDLTRDLARAQTGSAQHAEMQERLRLEFDRLAAAHLDQAGRRLAEDSSTRLQDTLLPLRERLAEFEKRVEHSYQQEARERFSLQQEVRRLAELNQQMNEEAQRLTRALKGESKTQGAWGELVLSRVLENSGLREGEEFVVQGKDLSLSGPDGRRLQPDVLIRLPGSRHLILDAKVSLTAFERYASAPDEPARQQALRQHLNSVLSHIHQLSDKHYPGIDGLNSPDFVLLFMPLEPAFSLALQGKPDLFTHAWEKRIVLVSPATLLATLRTVSSLWSLEHQNRHAAEIARQGGLLYDRFVAFVEELDRVGSSIRKAQEACDEAQRRLREGHNSLTARAEKLRELGARTSRQLET